MVINTTEKKAIHPRGSRFTFPRDQLSLDRVSLVEHMRGDALCYMVQADDVIGEWLWELANKIERDMIKLNL